MVLGRMPSFRCGETGARAARPAGGDGTAKNGDLLDLQRPD